MHTRLSLVFALAALVSAFAVHSATTSQPQAQTPPETAVQVGGGAVVCAEGKAARLSRRAEMPLSVASSNIDITYYHLDVELDMISDIDGVVRVEGVVVDSPLSVLVLDLALTMTVSSVQFAGGTPLAFSHALGALSITMPAPITVGGLVAVDIAYGGKPSDEGFGYFVFGTRAGDRFAWSLSEPYGSREWWPCKDHPSDKADSVRVTVTVPSQYRVGSQGTLVGETSAGGKTTFDWVSHYPISSYLVSVAAGEYVRYTDAYVRPPALEAEYGALVMPLEDLVYDDGSSARFGGWANVTDPMKVFEEWFGPYPFAGEKYGHAEATFGGGMEHQTMTTMGGSSMSLVAHELAHQWYGDGISPENWPHLWLNEGFATYGELLYWDARPLTYPGNYASALATIYDSARNAAGTLVLEDTTSVSNMFNHSRVYHKGAIVLYMLRYVIGDSTFKDLLRTYAEDPLVRYGVAETDDFQQLAEGLSGMDLDAFFSQWVTDGTGYPTYRMSSAWEPSAGGYTLWVTVEQTQDLPQSNVSVFEMPLIIAVQTASGEQRFRVDNDQRIQMFELSLAEEPLSVAVDPDKNVLRSDGIAVAAGDRPPSPRLAIQALMPNPASNSLAIGYTLGRAADARIDVYDVAGRRVLSRVVPAGGTAGERFETLDTSALAAGVYFLRVKSAYGQATRKFVVVR